MKKNIIGITLILSLLSITGFSIFADTEDYDPIKSYSKIEKTESGLNGYKDSVAVKNEIIKEAKLTDVRATITFNTPIDIEDLKKYQKKYGIELVQVNARATNYNNERWTISSLTSMGLDKTNEIVQQQVAEIEDGKFIGYTDVYALVDYDKIDNMIKDKITYLVDTSGDNHFSPESKSKHNSRSFFPHSLTWDLEDLKQKSK